MAKDIQNGYAQPGFQLRLCLYCGMPAHWKIDKKGRPYHSCGFCQTKLFLYGHTAFSGVEILQELILRSGLQRFRRAVQARTAKRVQRVPTRAGALR